MKLKNRKRLMMTLMSLMLATTGCSSKEDNNPRYNYQEASYEIIDAIINGRSFYNDDYKSEKDKYAKFYQNYLDNFIAYMSKSQYDAFITLAQNMNKEERNEYPETLEYMNSMFNVTDTSYGRGFYKIFNTRLINDNLTFNGRVGGNISNHVNTLVALVNNDEELYPSIFSGDINNVIDCIVKNTGIDDRELVEELILKMDLYTDNVAYIDYKSEMIKTSYEDRIKEIIRQLIDAKKAKDKEFADSLYAKLLRESTYYGYDTYEIIPGITLNSFDVIVYEEEGKYAIRNISKLYLYSNKTIEDIRAMSVDDILTRSFHLEEEEYYTVENTMQLLMCLIDSNIEFKDIQNGSDLHKIIYRNLRKYFSSEDEFNIFVLKLCVMSHSTFDQYFNFFIQSIQENGITNDDFLRYAALVNYNNRRRHISIDYADSTNYIDSKELAKMTEEEYKDIVSASEENYLFGNMDYQKYFKQIEDILAQNDLGYELLYNKDCKVEWVYGEREIIAESASSFISAPVFPEMMEYNGTYVIFYEYPDDYQDGVAVDVFTNINNETMAREHEGFKAEIIDPVSGKPRIIYVVDMGPSKDGYSSIRFMIDAETFNKTHNNPSTSTLTLGGQQ